MVLEKKTLEYPLDCKEIKPVNPEGNQSWIFIERTNAEAEAPILWPPDAKNWLISKDPDGGKDWRQEYNRGWDGWMASLTQWTWVWAPLGVGDGQRSLACYSPFGGKESDMTERRNWTDGTTPKDAVCVSFFLFLLILLKVYKWTSDKNFCSNI